MSTYAASFVIDEAVYIANIDGQTGATQRHNPTRLYSLLNQAVESLRNIKSSAGHTGYLAETTVATLPARTANEDYIVVPYPATALEIRSVDVQDFVSSVYEGSWIALDPISFALNRDVSRGSGTRRGQWAVKKLPKENGASALTAGEIAVFPPELTGQYKIWFIERWVQITSAQPTFLIELAPDELEWVSLYIGSRINRRDNDKKRNQPDFIGRMGDLERRIREGAQRIQRSGPKIPRRVNGWGG